MKRDSVKISDKVFNYLTSLFGEESANKYLNFVEEYPSVYVRVNKLKITITELSERLEKRYGIRPEIFEGLPNVLKFLEREEDLGKTLEIALGYYYIQGFSSMLPPYVLNPKPSDKVLDLCSAPGSKTTQMAELMGNEGTLIVNESQLDRIKALVFNLDRMNIVNTGVVHSKGELLSKYYCNYFDKILVDAPCSGLGIIQKKIEVNQWWNLDRVNKLHNLQVKLLVSAIKMLKVGGELVYSTCTLTPEENELVIAKILKNYPVEIIDINLSIEHRKGITEYNDQSLHPDLNKAVRILPWEADSDGFFLVKLRKTDHIDLEDKEKWKKSYTSEFLNSDDKKVEKYLSYVSEIFGIDPDVLKNYNYILKRRDLFFINRSWEAKNLGLFHRIGTKFGTIDKRDNIVLHSNAAQILDKNITRNIYFVKNKEELRIYLAGGLILDAGMERGQYVIKYNDYVLGTAIVTRGGIKSRFPRSKRTQAIRLGNF
ncbi:MAG: RsmB/NOP family class I SAM-dependent RNA methyltransferase [Ignavibacteria bacterium]